MHPYTMTVIKRLALNLGGRGVSGREEVLPTKCDTVHCVQLYLRGITGVYRCVVCSVLL